MTFDPVTQDNPVLDKNFPTFNSLFSFSSTGNVLTGRVFVAQGEQAHPTLFLLHGFPGTEQNYDLAHVFRRAGWNVVIFHYSGAWGSGGVHTFGRAIEDVQNMLAYFATPEIQERYRVDSSRFVLMGHSFGGFLSLLCAAHNPRVYAAASLAGFNMGGFAKQIADDEAQAAIVAQVWQEDVTPLNGATGRALVAEIIEHRMAWDLVTNLGGIGGRKVCLVAGSRDTVGPVETHHTPLAAALSTHAHVTQHIFDSDHGFSDARIALARVLVDWLRTL